MTLPKMIQNVDHFIPWELQSENGYNKSSVLLHGQKGKAHKSWSLEGKSQRQLADIVVRNCRVDAITYRALDRTRLCLVSYLEQMILAWQWLLDLWGLEAAGQRSPQSQPEGLLTA